MPTGIKVKLIPCAKAQKTNKNMNIFCCFHTNLLSLHLHYDYILSFCETLFSKADG